MLSTKSLRKQAGVRKLQLPLQQGLAGLMGFVMAGGRLLELYPLGLGFVLGVPERWLFSAAAGACFGSLLLEPMAALRTVGAIAAALAGRCLDRNSRWTGIGAGCGCLLLVQLLLALSGLATWSQNLAAAGEALMAGVFGYGLRRVGFAPPAAPLVWGMAIIPALEAWSWGYFRPGFLAAAVSGLMLAYRGGEKNASVAVICWSAALAASDPPLLPAALAMTGGVLAGAVFAPGEKVGCAALFAAAQLCALGLTGEAALQGQILGLTAESLLLFLLLPRQYLLGLPGEPRALPENRTGALVGVCGRLTSVADALADVAETVDLVMDKLPKAGEGYDYTVNYLAGHLCAGCPQRERCWIRDYSDTVKGLYEVKPLLEQGGRLSVEQLPSQFYLCENPSSLCSALCQGYAVQCSRRESALRMTALRCALSEQYGAMAGALARMAEELAQSGTTDETRSGRVCSLFESLELEPLEALVQLDALGRMKVTVTVTRTPFEEDELETLTEEVGHLCRRSFSQPQVNHCRTVTTLIFGEKPEYEVRFGLAARPAREGVSGDAARQICDLTGTAHMLLCDGMGVGRCAAVDGAMAANLTTRLLRTGFAGDTAARLVNVALNLKSEEESSAALDLLSVDLYTGRVQLYKAGAAPSYTVQNSRVRAVEGAGLPVGILKEVSGKEHRFGLAAGDWVVLVSDGVLGDGDVWLRQQIELCAAVGNSPQEMADILADTARRRRSPGEPPDDITVEVLRLERA